MANEIDSEHGALVADTVATVTLKADFGEAIRIHNRGASDLFVRLDGTDPVVAAAGTSIVEAGDTKSFIVKKSDAALDVKLISSGTPDYSVETY